MCNGDQHHFDYQHYGSSDTHVHQLDHELRFPYLYLDLDFNVLVVHHVVDNPVVLEHDHQQHDHARRAAR